MPVEEHLEYAPEPPLVEVRVVVWGAIASLLLVALAIGLFSEIYQARVPIKTVPPPQTFAEPRVVTSQDETAQRHRLAAEQSQRLKSWGWANDQHTLIQVPIDRAMQLLAQKGQDAYAPLLPAQPTLSSPAAAAQNATTPDSAPHNPVTPGEPSRNAAAPPGTRQ
jgi:hypothetical protein